MFFFFNLIYSYYNISVSDSRRSLRGSKTTPSVSAVKLDTEDEQQVVIDNGIVRITLSKPEGYVVGISYNGIENVLESRNEEQDRGYFDVVWNKPGYNGTFQRYNHIMLVVFIITDCKVMQVSYTELK